MGIKRMRVFKGLKDVDELFFWRDVFLLRNSPGVVFIVTTTKNGLNYLSQ